MATRANPVNTSNLEATLQYLETNSSVSTPETRQAYNDAADVIDNMSDSSVKTDLQGRMDKIDKDMNKCDWRNAVKLVAIALGAFGAYRYFFGQKAAPAPGKDFVLVFPTCKAENTTECAIPKSYFNVSKPYYDAPIGPQPKVEPSLWSRIVGSFHKNIK